METIKNKSVSMIFTQIEDRLKISVPGIELNFQEKRDVESTDEYYSLIVTKAPSISRDQLRTKLSEIIDPVYSDLMSSHTLLATSINLS